VCHGHSQDIWLVRVDGERVADGMALVAEVCDDVHVVRSSSLVEGVTSRAVTGLRNR